MADLTEILDRLMARIEYNAHELETGRFVRVEYVQNFIEDEKTRSRLSEASCVFCDIIAGTAPATIVEEWPDAIAIVPLGPVVDGHILVIPRQHVADLAALPQVTAAVMYRAAHYAQRHDSANIITSMGRAATQSIDHLHIHVVPRTADDGLMVPWGTIYGDDPQAPHWCWVAQRLQDGFDARVGA